MTPRELIERFHTELFATGDLDTIDRFFAPDVLSHDMPPGFPQGIEGVRLFFSAFREGMPDVQVRIDEIVVEDDRAAVATMIEGTHTGAMMGIEATGRRISVRGIDMVRVADGRIVEHRGLTDTVGLLRQLSSPTEPS
jgi:steroid delta-isomerase-like uncharacterized protein